MEYKYSLDMLRLEYKIKCDVLERLLKTFEMRTDCEYWFSTKFFTYRHQFTFKTDLKNSYTLLCDFNGVEKTVNKSVVLEFNPNKVGSELGLISLIQCLQKLSNKPEKIVRFDCAIDIPVKRECCKLVKDQRTYSSYKNSNSDLTEYLGHRNKHGFVKLYNKSREMGLDFDLTRLEVTVSGDDIYKIKDVFPKVYIVNDLQLDLNFKVSDTDRVLLFSCIDEPFYLSMLGRKKRQKIEELIRLCSSILALDYAQYCNVLKSITDYTSYDIIFKEFS